MGLIDDDGVIGLEVSMALHGVEQDSIGHHFDLGGSRSLVCEADLIANQAAKLYF